MHVLVVNPNTTEAMTRLIAAATTAAAHPTTTVEAVTSKTGPASIEGYYDEALAVPGLLRAIARGEAAGADGAVIACFDDTGLDAARALVAIPVVGTCEAALAAAGMVARRISIVTTLPRSVAPIEALVARYGMQGRARVHASGIPVLALEDDPGARVRLRIAIDRAVALDGSDAVVLGCAGMADLAATLATELGLPVIDGVAAGIKMIEALVGLRLKTSKAGAYAPPLAKAYSGVLAEFAPDALTASPS